MLLQHVHSAHSLFQEKFRGTKLRWISSFVSPTLSTFSISVCLSASVAHSFSLSLSRNPSTLYIRNTFFNVKWPKLQITLHTCSRIACDIITNVVDKLYDALFFPLEKWHIIFIHSLSLSVSLLLPLSLDINPIVVVAVVVLAINRCWASTLLFGQRNQLHHFFAPCSLPLAPSHPPAAPIQYELNRKQSNGKSLSHRKQELYKFRCETYRTKTNRLMVHLDQNY